VSGERADHCPVISINGHVPRVGQSFTSYLETYAAVLFAMPAHPYSSAFLLFDEDELVGVSRDLGIPIDVLMNPYVERAQSVLGVDAIGFGFEIGPVSSLEDQVLREAGVRRVFLREEGGGKWYAKDLGPMVGHYT